MTKGDAIALIYQELERAERLHPEFPTDPIHAVAIMAEECGEAVQAALDLTYSPAPGDIRKTQLEKEIIQTGAMAIRCLLNLHNFKAVKSEQVPG